MKKMVNGSVVDIPNFRLFEKAAEGAIVGKLASSSISNKITVRSQEINKYLEIYETFYKSMPYPLYVIEEDIKYAALATLIRRCVKNCCRMSVDGALYIHIDEDEHVALQIIADTWGVVKASANQEDNSDLSKYEGSVGYEEFNWLLDTINNRSSRGNFYQEFMPEFIKACNNETMVIKFELSNMLTFASVPQATELKANSIIDLDNRKEYWLDMFESGERQLDEKKYSIDLTGAKPKVASMRRTSKVYDYDLYVKHNQPGRDGRIKKADLIGMEQLFMMLAALRIKNCDDCFEEYRGVIVDRQLIYILEDTIYTTKSVKADDNITVAKGVEFIAYDRGMIYFSSSTPLKRWIRKETIYSHSIRDNSKRLCKIQFTENL